MKQQQESEPPSCLRIPLLMVGPHSLQAGEIRSPMRA
jgi:hypothetical protein